MSMKEVTCTNIDNDCPNSMITFEVDDESIYCSKCGSILVEVIDDEDDDIEEETNG